MFFYFHVDRVFEGEKRGNNFKSVNFKGLRNVTGSTIEQQVYIIYVFRQSHRK